MNLSNEHLIIEADERGAQLVRIYSPKYDHEYLWINDPSIWGWRAPNLFPVIGELKDGKYFYDDNWYYMGRHGFIRDAPFSCKQTGNTLSFSISYDDQSLSQFPFKFRLQIQYVLSGSTLEVWYHVQNLDDKSMPFSIGGHPAFSVSPLEDHYLQFEVNETILSDSLNDRGLRTNVHRSGVEAGNLQLTPDLFDNDALILSNIQSSYCELLSKSTPRMIRFYFGQFPYLGIWSKPEAPFVCIEPWQGVADRDDVSGLINEKEGMILLPPESMFRIGYKMEFG